MGIQDYQHARYEQAVEHLERALDRDPYSAESYYHLAISQLALGQETQAERNLYFIGAAAAGTALGNTSWGGSTCCGRDLDGAVRHFEAALSANGEDLCARVALALALGDRGERARAEQELLAAGRMQPSSRLALAARYLLTGDAATQAELLRMLGRQSQEAMTVALFFRDLRRWNDAVRLLRLVEQEQPETRGVLRASSTIRWPTANGAPGMLRRPIPRSARQGQPRAISTVSRRGWRASRRWRRR